MKIMKSLNFYFSPNYIKVTVNLLSLCILRSLKASLGVPRANAQNEAGSNTLEFPPVKLLRIMILTRNLGILILRILQISS